MKELVLIHFENCESHLSRRTQAGALFPFKGEGIPLLSVTHGLCNGRPRVTFPAA